MEHQLTKSQFLTRIYAWMTLGLTVTFAVAALVARYRPNLVYQPAALLILTLAQVLVVISFSRQLMQASHGSAMAMFVFYSALNGITMSTVFLFFNLGVIYLAFGAAAVNFAVMAIYGVLTKQNLSPLRKILTGGIIALLIMTLVAALFGFTRLQWWVCIIGIAVFSGLTAYDTQRLLQLHNAFPNAGGKLAIYGALQLYLDFINLFQFILILISGRRQK